MNTSRQTEFDIKAFFNTLKSIFKKHLYATKKMESDSLDLNGIYTEADSILDTIVNGIKENGKCSDLNENIDITFILELFDVIFNIEEPIGFINETPNGGLSLTVLDSEIYHPYNGIVYSWNRGNDEKDPIFVITDVNKVYNTSDESLSIMKYFGLCPTMYYREICVSDKDSAHSIAIDYRAYHEDVELVHGEREE